MLIIIYTNIPVIYYCKKDALKKGTGKNGFPIDQFATCVYVYILVGYARLAGSEKPLPLVRYVTSLTLTSPLLLW